MAGIAEQDIQRINAGALVVYPQHHQGTHSAQRPMELALARAIQDHAGHGFEGVGTATMTLPALVQPGNETFNIGMAESVEAGIARSAKHRIAELVSGKIAMSDQQHIVRNQFLHIALQPHEQLRRPLDQHGLVNHAKKHFLCFTNFAKHVHDVGLEEERLMNYLT